jgi:hypothetical protein
MRTLNAGHELGGYDFIFNAPMNASLSLAASEPLADVEAEQLVAGWVREQGVLEALAKQQRQALALAIHSLMDPDVQPVGFPRSTPASPIAQPLVRRSWLARVRDAITHPSNKEHS